MDPALIDVKRSKITADGWHLSVSLTGMTVNSDPNMATTAFTGEGFVTGTATLTIDGSGDNRAVKSRALRVWALLGCEDQALPGRAEELILGYKVLGPLREDGQVQFVVSFRELHVGVGGSCRGPVLLRLHARAWMSTDHSDDTVDVYSNVVPLSPINAPSAKAESAKAPSAKAPRAKAPRAKAPRAKAPRKAPSKRASSDERGLREGGYQRGDYETDDYQTGDHQRDDYQTGDHQRDEYQPDKYQPYK